MSNVIQFTFSRAEDWAGEIEFDGENLTDCAFEMSLVHTKGARQSISLDIWPNELSVARFRLLNDQSKDLPLGEWRGDLVQIVTSVLGTFRDTVAPVSIRHRVEGGE